MGRILVVDDEPDIGRVLRLAIEARGHTVVLADDGARGLGVLRRQRPDVVVLDLIMPAMDGFTMLERLKTEEKLRDVPILVLTALTTRTVRERCEALGAVEVVTKPFDPYTVADKVEALLIRRASA